MKLEQQVCALEYSQKLEKLGVKQESLWWWQKLSTDYLDYKKGFHLTNNPMKFEDKYSAFTVAELGENFFFNDNSFSAKRVYSQKVSSKMDIKKKWECVYEYDSESGWYPDYRKHIQFADTEANARAKMLIYLIEKGQVKLCLKTKN